MASVWTDDYIIMIMAGKSSLVKIARKTMTIVFVLYNVTVTLRWHRELKCFLAKDKDSFMLNSQYHIWWWWPSNTRIQTYHSCFNSLNSLVSAHNKGYKKKKKSEIGHSPSSPTAPTFTSELCNFVHVSLFVCSFSRISHYEFTNVYITTNWAPLPEFIDCELTHFQGGTEQDWLQKVPYKWWISN